LALEQKNILTFTHAYISSCIICRNPTESLTDEHIYPEAVGGDLKAAILCKACNSKIGEKIDGPYTAQKNIQLARVAYGLGGKSRKMPSPLSKIHTICTPDGEIEVRLNSDFKPIVQPRAPKIQVRADGSLFFSVSRDISERWKLPKIVKTAFERFFRSKAGRDLGWTEKRQKQLISEAAEKAKSVQPRETKIDHMLGERVVIDLNAIYAEQLKVVYEVCALEFGERFLIYHTSRKD
jgi:hypothetical protein